MDDITVRPATGNELSTVAELRWQWILENGNIPLTTREQFTKYFTAWAHENSASHRCFVLLRFDSIVGMAWLAVLKRVPMPSAFERSSGDVQCVYITPNERANGLGGKRVDAVLEYARELGLERVTVHSSTRAIAAYSRHGFAVSRRLLQADFTSSA